MTGYKDSAGCNKQIREERERELWLRGVACLSDGTGDAISFMLDRMSRVRCGGNDVGEADQALEMMEIWLFWNVSAHERVQDCGAEYTNVKVSVTAH